MYDGWQHNDIQCGNGGHMPKAMSPGGAGAWVSAHWHAARGLACCTELNGCGAATLAPDHYSRSFLGLKSAFDEPVVGRAVSMSGYWQPRL